MKSQTPRTKRVVRETVVRETVGFGGFSPAVVAEVLGREEEDPGLDIPVLFQAGRQWSAERRDCFLYDALVFLIAPRSPAPERPELCAVTPNTPFPHSSSRTPGRHRLKPFALALMATLVLFTIRV